MPPETMDSDIQELVTRFKLLRSNSARHIAYHQIIDQMTPHEWRDVKSRINERSFQKDILGALPLEIAVQITQYLYLADLHLLRGVSRRWNDVLSSKLVCSVVFRQYTGASLNLDEEFKSTLAQYSRHRVRLEQGKPFGKAQVNSPFVAGEEISNFDYSNGRYSWTVDNDTTIVVHDLRSQKTQRFCAKNRERFIKTRLSQHMLAAITIRGYCHSWNLQTEEMHTVRFPNTNISLFVLSGFRVATCLKKSSMDGMMDSAVIHYDLQARTTHTIPNVRNLALVGLDSSTRYLTTVCLESEDGGQLRDMSNSPFLRVVNYELHNDGNVSTARTYTLALPIAKYRDWESITIMYSLQDGSRNRMGILQTALLLTLSVTYDPGTLEICVHRLLRLETSHPPFIVDVGRNILYYIQNDDGKRSVWISNPYAEKPLYPSCSMDLGLPRDPRGGVTVFAHTYRLLVGDSQSVSMVDASGTQVWFFEESEYSGGPMVLGMPS
ncbi:hypothetical protein BDW59DRAFT_104462 [Aspergillus cavernicola]|uniref:F-box domain-containing protein n=1 Tax=Aspergillus cavernicola TaxID=176166 RepID=A0ABR4IZV7_9EURO